MAEETIDWHAEMKHAWDTDTVTPATGATGRGMQEAWGSDTHSPMPRSGSDESSCAGTDKWPPMAAGSRVGRPAPKSDESMESHWTQASTTKSSSSELFPPAKIHKPLVVSNNKNAPIISSQISPTKIQAPAAKEDAPIMSRFSATKIQAPPVKEDVPITTQFSPTKIQAPAAKEEAPIQSQFSPTKMERPPVKEAPIPRQFSPPNMQRPSVDEDAPILSQFSPTKVQAPPVKKEAPILSQFSPTALQTPPLKEEAPPIKSHEPPTDEDVPILPVQAPSAKEDTSAYPPTKLQGLPPVKQATFVPPVLPLKRLPPVRRTGVSSPISPMVVQPPSLSRDSLPGQFRMQAPPKEEAVSGRVSLTKVQAQAPPVPEEASTTSRPLSPTKLTMTDIMANRPVKLHVDMSSSDSSSLGSSDSDSDQDKFPTTPTIKTPVGVAPPPPLRNIPHQTPDLTPGPPTVPQQLPMSTRPTPPPSAGIRRPKHRPQATAAQLLPTNVVPNEDAVCRRASLTVPPPGFAQRSHRGRMSIDNSDLSQVTLPNKRTVSGARDYGSESAAVKPKHVLFSDKPDVEIPPPEETPNQARVEAESEWDKLEQNATSSDAESDTATSHETSTEKRRASFSVSAAPSSHETETQRRGSFTIGAGRISSMPTAPINIPSRMKPPRAPPRETTPADPTSSSLSSENSDSSGADLSSSGYDEEEAMDKFDADGVMTPRMFRVLSARTSPPLSLPSLVHAPHAPPSVQSTLPSPSPSMDSSILGHPKSLSSSLYRSPISQIMSPPKSQSAPVSVRHDDNSVDEPTSMITRQRSLPSYNESGVRRLHAGATGELHNIWSTPPDYYSARGFSRDEGVAVNAEQRQVRLNCPELSNIPIHMAAMEGVAIAQMKALVREFGVDFSDDGGRTPLMYAVIGNQPKMCELLIKMKASVSCRDMTGLTALLWATYKAHADIIKVLLKNGADISQLDQEKRSAFHWAMKTPNIQCLRWLCKLTNSHDIIDQKDTGGLTALHWAVMSDQCPHVKMLLSHTRADVSAQDSEGRTPLNYAVLNFSPACIRAILDHNASAASMIDSKGRTSLHYACAEGSADCVRTLLSYQKSDIHCTDNAGTTPLHWAASANQPGLVQLLLRRGADRNQKDANNYTPQDYAEQRGHTECVRILTSYNIQRPGSAISLSSGSHVSVSLAAEPPTLDEQGHVIFKRFQRQFSLTRSISSMDRQPADGQAQAESLPEEQGGSGEAGELAILPTASLEQQQEGGGTGEAGGQEVTAVAAGESQPSTSLVPLSLEQQLMCEDADGTEIERFRTPNPNIPTPRQRRGSRRRRRRHGGWQMLLCCGLCASSKQTSRVAPCTLDLAID